MNTEQGRNGGDLGLRVASRRRELGLSVDDVARRAGMAPGYVAHLEHQVAHPSTSALARLARALDTSPDVLLGVEDGAPPGRNPTHSETPALIRLSVGACMDRLRPGGVGRLAFVPRGEVVPEVLPVNFVVADDQIVFRTTRDGPIAAALRVEVGFQVDRLHGVLSQGWSVLVKGMAWLLRDPAELDDAASLNIRPWAGGKRDLVVVITPRTITGRQISSTAVQ